ncbi:MAG: pantoate--beta-alanine ligase [Bacteroidales bacterium]|nr:pantoate--beta-alanine ligase [Bacteroidales bacterium]
MELIQTKADLFTYMKSEGFGEKLIGLVPTMGALHKGHLSLIETAAGLCERVMVTIFVNPTQFNDPNDLRNYPRNLEKDLELLAAQGMTDIVFAPGEKEIYPEPDTRVFDFGQLDKVMEGAHRPGHFNGVAQVVSRLFDITRPNMAFFGQKDFQQLAVIRELVRKMKYPIEIITCPIIREDDGLAMSSRNQLLNPEERKHAAQISKTLFRARELAASMDPEKLCDWAVKELNSDPLIQVEYFQIVDSQTLLPADSWDSPCKKQACVAVKLGKIRLIDNINFD